MRQGISLRENIIVTFLFSNDLLRRGLFI